MWLGLVAIYLSHQKPIVLLPKQQPLRVLLIYWIKNMQVQIKKKKPQHQPLVSEATALQKYFVSSNMLLID